MNLMPAASKVALSCSKVSGVLEKFSPSMRANVRMDTPDSLESRSRDQSIRPRAALICAAVMVADFMPLTLDAMLPREAQFVPLAAANNHTKEVAMATKSNETQVPTSKHVTIPPPKFEVATFTIHGSAPLVIHRFSKKTKEQMKQKMETGKAASSRKNREAKSTDDLFEESRYRHKDGWDGFNASAIRNAMISVCRLVGFKMTLAKLSIFVLADGWDAEEPQIPLVRIYADAVKQEDMARVETGQPYVTVRAAYHGWSSKIRIRWDADQFTLNDVANLLSRVGLQAGIGEGRPDSKHSAGMGWGLFDIQAQEQKAA